MIIKKVLLDTSFIITCVRQKIDFFSWLIDDGYSIIIPEQVFIELEGLSKNDSNAKLALNLIKKNKTPQLDLNNKNTDKAIINYAKKNPDMIIATLDKEIKNNTPNRKLIILGKKQLDII